MKRALALAVMLLAACAGPAPEQCVRDCSNTPHPAGVVEVCHFCADSAGTTCAPEGQDLAFCGPGGPVVPVP